jgi:hypothetical protein
MLELQPTVSSFDWNAGCLLNSAIQDWCINEENLDLAFAFSCIQAAQFILITIY